MTDKPGKKEGTSDRVITSISKSYSRKVSIDYQTWGFQTGITANVEITDPEELKKEGRILFKIVKEMTEADVMKVEKEIEAKKAEDQ